MIASLIRWLGGIVGPKAAKPVLIGGAVFALILVLGVAKCAYDRSVIEKHEARIDARVRPADTKAAAAREADNTAIAHDKQEITNALAPLPDARLSDRQRARACAILVRQSGNPHPPGC